jgi:hypothetical protein
MLILGICPARRGLGISPIHPAGKNGAIDLSRGLSAGTRTSGAELGRLVRTKAPWGDTETVESASTQGRYAPPLGDGLASRSARAGGSAPRRRAEAGGGLATTLGRGKEQPSIREPHVPVRTRWTRTGRWRPVDYSGGSPLLSSHPAAASRGQGAMSQAPQPGDANTQQLPDDDAACWQAAGRDASGLGIPSTVR